jgi:ubiquitin carboxyl-terminal hydrolase L5
VNLDAHIGPTFAADFGQRKLKCTLEVIDVPEGALLSSWQECVRDAVPAKIAVEDELAKAMRENVNTNSAGAFDVALTARKTEQIKRTHDYEPFIRDFVACLHQDGLLSPLIGQDKDGRRLPAPSATSRTAKR